MPYRLSNGTRIALNWADLIDGSLDAPINIDEDGAAVSTPGGRVWTNLKPDGTRNGTDRVVDTCKQWFQASDDSDSDQADSDKGNYGLTGESTGQWTSRGRQECARRARLYCFEQ